MIQSRLISAFSKLKIPPFHLPSPSLNSNLYLAATPSAKLLSDYNSNRKKGQGGEQQLILMESQGKHVGKSNGLKIAQAIEEERKRIKEYNNRVMKNLQELIPNHHLKIMKMLNESADSCVAAKKEIADINGLEKVIRATKWIEKINENILEKVSKLTAESEKEIEAIISLQPVKPNTNPSPIEQAYKQQILALLQKLREQVVKRAKGSHSQFRRRMGENAGLMNPDFDESYLQIYSSDLRSLGKYVESNGFNYFGYLTSIIDKMNEHSENTVRSHKKETKKGSK